MKKFPNKMVSSEGAEQPFHFSGAGSNLPPLVIKAKSIEEAEKIWRQKNDEAAPAAPSPISGSYQPE